MSASSIASRSLPLVVLAPKPLQTATSVVPERTSVSGIVRDHAAIPSPCFPWEVPRESAWLAADPR